LDACQYVHVFEVKDDKENLKEKRQKCGLRIGLRTIEFRHPDYRDLSREFILCDSHYRVVFGALEDQEREAWRKKQNAVYKYKGDFAKAKNLMETGIGFFNAKEFKANHYRRVEDAIRYWDNIRRKHCRYEICNLSLRSVKKIFPVRVYTPTGFEYQNYNFCCENHWKRKLYAIEPKVKQDQKVIPKTLDDYLEEMKV